MKIFAFYLPQFHTIPENNKWWGENFTEWVNVKKSSPLFPNHNQPRIPFNQNYYNLLDKETLIWQSELLKKYNIDGLCFYHYWFTGKQLLEKPAEILLKNKEINIPFFFSWANEPWTRSWDGLNKNVLMDQTYGEYSDWVDHFNYLLPFFKDKRYIKHNNYPIFVLYRSASFPYCQEWINCWRELAKKNGIGDIHFVSSLTSFENDSRNLNFNAYLNFEPLNTLAHHMTLKSKITFNDKLANSINKRLNSLKKIINKETKTVEKFNYHEVWENILQKTFNQNIYAGAFVDWDNTPRKKFSGSVAINSNPKQFELYFYKLYRKALKENTPYIFINAWNEWAEGAYLEPDCKNHFQYLEIIKRTTEDINLL